MSRTYVWHSQRSEEKRSHHAIRTRRRLGRTRVPCRRLAAWHVGRAHYTGKVDAGHRGCVGHYRHDTTGDCTAGCQEGWFGFGLWGLGLWVIGLLLSPPLLSPPLLSKLFPSSPIHLSRTLTNESITLSCHPQEINFCEKAGCRVLGVVENMCGFQCPNCNHVTDILPPSGEDSEVRVSAS